MRRQVAIVAAVAAASVLAGPAAASSQSVAALQVALRVHGLYPGPVDGVAGPLTHRAILTFQKGHRLPASGHIGPQARRLLGPLGVPLLGRRELALGARGWDVSALEFRLIHYGLPRSSVDGRFTATTATALRRFQRDKDLIPDGVAGVRTFRALAHAGSGGFPRRVLRMHVVRSGEGFYSIAARFHVGAGSLARANGLRLTSLLVPGQRLRLPTGARIGTPAPAGARAALASASSVHVVRPGEGFFAIAAHWSVSPWELARVNGLELSSVLVPGQRLRLPAGARLAGGLAPASQDAVRASLDRWSATYGVDVRLARALAWMESGFQPGVVSNVGAIGVMQLLPETWEWVDEILLGARTPRTYDGNVQAGVRYLKWQLEQFGGNARLALAGYYQGARAVRERGLFDDTRQYVSVIMQLYGSV